MEYKVLEEQDIELMKDVLKDDNMIFDKKYLQNFINNKDAYGFIAKHIYFKFGFIEEIGKGHGDEFDPTDYTLYLKKII